MFSFFIAFRCYLGVFGSVVWPKLGVLRDPSLKQFASRSESTLFSTKAAVTINAYMKGFQRWKSFASSKDVQPFPVMVEHVALYLQRVIETTRSPSAVD